MAPLEHALTTHCTVKQVNYHKIMCVHYALHR